MSSPFIQQPGVTTLGTLQYRNVFTNPTSAIFQPGFRWVAGASSRDFGNTPTSILRAGLLMGKLTASDEYAPSILGVVASAVDSTGGNGTITVSAAAAAEIVRRIGATGTLKLAIVGPATEGGSVTVDPFTYSGVNTTTGAITASALAGDYVAGSIIIAHDDGSGYPRTLVHRPYGIDVTNPEGTSVDAGVGPLLVGGQINSNMIVDFPSMDASVKTWVETQLNTNGQFIFSRHF